MKTAFVVCCIITAYVVLPCAAQVRSAWSAGFVGGVFSSYPGGDNADISRKWYGTTPDLDGDWAPDFGKDIESQSTMLVSGGVYLQYHFTKTFAVQAGALYRPEAMYYEQMINFHAEGYYPWLRKFSLEGRCSYIEFPLVAKAIFDIKGDLLPYVYAGPSISVLISQSLDGRVGGLGPNESGNPFRAEAEAGSVVTGACIGGGVYVRTREKVKLGLDARYRWTMQSAITSVELEGERSNDIDLRFSSWGISGVMEVTL